MLSLPGCAELFTCKVFRLLTKRIKCLKNIIHKCMIAIPQASHLVDFRR